MDEMLAMLRQQAECRSPIVFYEEDVPTGETPISIAQRFADLLDAHMEAVTCTYADDSVTAGRHIDTAIQNGDWTLIMFGDQFDVAEFLRFVARKMITLMPNVQESPNLELFRLWLVVPKVTNLPMLFKQIAIFIDPSVAKGAKATSPKNNDNSESTSGPMPLPDIRRESSTVEAMEPSPNSSQRNFSIGTANSSTGGEIMSKVGPLFHRRLELISGQQPQSTMTNAHELHARRVQSAAVIRRSGAVSQREISSQHPITPPRQRTSIGSRSSVDEGGADKDDFENDCITTIQTIHSNILRTYYQNNDAGKRMLKELKLLTEKRSGLVGGKESSSTGAGDIPRADASGLELGEVMQRLQDGFLIRKGTWRALPVLVEQMNSSRFEARHLDLVRLRFQLRHPNINSPMSLLSEDHGEFVYLVSQLPLIGPVPVFLRESNFAAVSKPEQRIGLYAAHLGMSVAKGLSFLHGSGVLHRDVSARNVVDMGGNNFVLQLTEKCLMMDSNEARDCSSDGIAPRFSSPEALTTSRYDAKDDIWGLGVVLWETLSLCHSPPFHAITHKDDVVSLVSRGHRLTKPEHCGDVFWDRIVAPCFGTRKFRPSLDHLISAMSAYIEEH